MRHRSGNTDWMSNYAIRWPLVLAKRLEPYVSVFTPRVTVSYGIQPNNLPLILAKSDEPALYQARESSIEPPDAPRLSGPFPPAPHPPGKPPPSSMEPKWEQYAPEHPKGGFLTTLSDTLTGARGARERAARQQFDRAYGEWKRDRYARERNERDYERTAENFRRNMAEYARNRERLENELEADTAAHVAHVRQFEEQRAADLAAFDNLLASAANGDKGSIERLALQACLAIPMPLAFPRTPTAHFEEIEGILLLTVNVPNLEESRLGVQLKTKRRDATEKEIRAAQEFTVHALGLRILHEVFATPELGGVRMAGVNLALEYTDRRNGKRMNEVVGSQATTREEFAGVDVARVDPRLCFRSLKGVATPSFHEPAPVRPVLQFGSADGRIVDGREIVDHLEQQTNLAALDWEDFEHIVRELFAKLFSSRSEAEVHVTRASRDYGVDALIFDPDPIHGGKFVIQAKRYVNTVNVAAVRDLFGTVQNEGANRGYLVTTSSFGPEAHNFAKGKPLTLIDGSHLLQLLKEHGYTFRIDLQEARQVLHGR